MSACVSLDDGKTFASFEQSYWHKINKINIFPSRAWEKLLLLIFNMKTDFFITPSYFVCQEGEDGEKLKK